MKNCTNWWYVALTKIWRARRASEYLACIAGMRLVGNKDALAEELLTKGKVRISMVHQVQYCSSKASGLEISSTDVKK
jgi:hypothetical protein